MALDDARITPAHAKNDGHNFFPKFGYAPGLIWVVGGVCLAGAVHDSFARWASTHRGGRSLAEISI